MKKGLFTAAVIAAMMMTQPVMAQEVVGQTEETVAQTEETVQEDAPESDMAEEYEGTTDFEAGVTVFSGENNETPIVSADPTDKEVQQPEKKIGWQTEEGKTYYYDENGNQSVGEKKIEGKWYYFDKEGVMQTGFQTIATKNGGKKRVCYGADGAILYGKQKVDEKWYYFHPVTGAVMYGEQKIDGKWHYCDRQTGAMAIGIQTITMSNGVQKTVCYGADGAMGYGEQKVNGRWYYCHPVTGAIQTGFVKLPNKMVYYGADGAMCYGEQKINGKWYYFNTVTGAMRIGFQTVPVKTGGTKTTYYGSDGTMRYGEQKINGKWYYFHPVTGAMQTGFVKLPKKTVYYGTDGAMWYGRQQVGEDSYYFHPVTGAMQTGLFNFGGDVWGFYDTNGKGHSMIDANTAVQYAHEFLTDSLSEDEKNEIGDRYVQYFSDELKMVAGLANPQYFIYAVVTRDNSDFDENTEDSNILFMDVMRVDAVTKECVHDYDHSGDN